MILENPDQSSWLRARLILTRMWFKWLREKPGSLTLWKVTRAKSAACGLMALDFWKLIATR